MFFSTIFLESMFSSVFLESVSSWFQSLSHVWLLWSHGVQHPRPFCPSLSPKFAYVHVHCIRDTIQPSRNASFSFSPQSFSALEIFPISHLFTSDELNTGLSALASVLPMSIQGWFPLRLTSLITLGPRNPQEASPAPQSEGINSLALFYLQYSSHNCTSRFHMYSLIYLFFSFWLT